MSSNSRAGFGRDRQDRGERGDRGSKFDKGPQIDTWTNETAEKKEENNIGGKA